jgi:integrase/recombinase XerD
VKKRPFKSHQKILQAYQHNLREVVGLSAKTCRDRFRDVGQFLEAVGIKHIADLAKLGPGHLVGYLSARSADYEPASLRNLASSVRDFMRFAQQRGWTSQSLDLAVPKIACGAQNDLPAYLSRQQLKLLLASWNSDTAEGRRDLAIALCLARLAMRAGEVAALVLEDLNWRKATLGISRSKNGNPALLPLLPEVGRAIAGYLRSGRPACHHRHVFLFQRPARPMNAQAISQVIRDGLRRCGIAVPRPGAHLLRHTVASHLVQNGASLKEVADLLRHRDLNSASVYAHVDLPNLRQLAQPWPKEGRR